MTPPSARSVAPLLMLSGASGLVFEIVWVRALTLWFGRTLPAVTTVLAAFMAGLALGGLFFGRIADRSRRPLAIYGALEIGIGLVGLAVSFVVIDGALVVPISRWLAGAGTLEATIRFLACFAVLLVPAALMGGTVPVVARALVRSESAGRRLAIVYAANTTGAVLGALAPDLVAIPAAGMTMTASAAALGDLLVGVWVSWRWRRAESQPPPAPAPARHPLAAHALYAVSGFVAMGYEIVWSRMLEHVTGVAASFAVLLACYLLALAAGTWMAAPFADRVVRPLRWAALGLVVSALLAVAPFFVLRPALASIVAWVPDAAGFTRQPLANALGRAAGVSCLLALGPCLAMGATFPFLGAFAARSRGPGTAVGQLLAINTFAGVLGTLTAGFAFLPSLGTQASMVVLALFAIATAAVVLVGTGDRAAGLTAAGAFLATFAAMGAIPADRTVRLLFPDAPGATIEMIAEGAVTSIAVARHEYLGQTMFQELRTPGVSMSNTAFGARRYMGMMAHVPLLLSRERKRALLVCYGVGNTARSLLSHPELERLDVVDISPEVIAASSWFARTTGTDPLDDPRVNVRIDDGRHHLLTTDERYDVVTAEPPPPTNAGVVNLYTREYYEAARRVLKPGGVVVQWLPVVELTDDEDRAITGAFVEVFPHAALFYGFKHQWFLVGSETPLAIDPEEWARAIEAPSVRADLAAIGVDGVGDLLAAYMAGDTTLRKVAGRETLTDDRPRLQYPWHPVAVPPPIPDGLVGSPLAVRELVADPRTLEPYERALRAADALYPQLAWMQHPLPEVRHLLLGTILWPWLDGDDPGRQARLEPLGVDDMHVAAAQAWLLDHPTDPVAHFVLGARAYYDRDFGRAWLLLLGVVDAPELEPSACLLRAGAARSIGHIDDARADLERAATISRTPAFASSVRAIAGQLSEPVGEAGPLGPPG